MKAIIVREFGDPEVMREEDVETPVPTGTQVLVRVAAVGVNPVETYIRSGKYPNVPQLPYTPGKDAAGIVESIGDAVTGWKSGDRVYTANSITGTYAEFIDLFREVQSRVQLGVALRSLGEVLSAASAGGEELVQARGHLLQSIWIFEEAGNDVELARSLRVYADLLRASPEYATDAETRKEEEDVRERAEGLFAKQMAQSEGRVPTSPPPPVR